MELNAEQVKKALDWLDSLVGNSNDSDIAMFTYQLLGILYDTCEELTEENEAWQMQLISTEEKSGKAYYELACEVEDLRAENERLYKEVDRLSQVVLYHDGITEMMVEEAKADTVREMLRRIKEDAVSVSLLSNPPKFMLEIREDALDQIAKEIVGEDTE